MFKNYISLKEIFKFLDFLFKICYNIDIEVENKNCGIE